MQTKTGEGTINMSRRPIDWVVHKLAKTYDEALEIAGSMDAEGIPCHIIRRSNGYEIQISE